MKERSHLGGLPACRSEALPLRIFMAGVRRPMSRIGVWLPWEDLGFSSMDRPLAAILLFTSAVFLSHSPLLVDSRRLDFRLLSSSLSSSSQPSPPPPAAAKTQVHHLPPPPHHRKGSSHPSHGHRRRPTSLRRHKKRRDILGKKIGLLFAGIALFLQVAFGLFLGVRRWQISRMDTHAPSWSIIPFLWDPKKGRACPWICIAFLLEEKKMGTIQLLLFFPVHNNDFKFHILDMLKKGEEGIIALIRLFSYIMYTWNFYTNFVWEINMEDGSVSVDSIQSSFHFTPLLVPCPRNRLILYQKTS